MGIETKMEIKRSDSKGRVTVGSEGRSYEVIRKQNGVIELWPIYTRDEIVKRGPEYWSELTRRMKHVEGVD